MPFEALPQPKKVRVVPDFLTSDMIALLQQVAIDKEVRQVNR